MLTLRLLNCLLDLYLRVSMLLDFGIEQCHKVVPSLHKRVSHSPRPFIKIFSIEIIGLFKSTKSKTALEFYRHNGS